MARQQHDRKLVLKKETVRILDPRTSKQIVGGADIPTTILTTGGCATIRTLNCTLSSCKTIRIK